MKKLKVFISILVAILVIIPQTSVFASSDIKITNISCSGNSTKAPGEEFVLNYNLSTAVDEVRISADDFSVIGGTDVDYDVSSGVNSFKLRCNPGTSAGVHTVTISAKKTYFYYDSSSDSYNSEEKSTEVRYSIMTSGSVDNTAPTLSFDVDKDKIENGDIFSLYVTVKNRSKSTDLKSVNLKLNGGDAFSVYKGSDLVFVESIAKNSSKTITKKFICNKSIGAGIYPISASISYGKDGETIEANYTIKVNNAKGKNSSVEFTPRLVISSFSYGDKSINGGKKFNLAFSIKNNSKSISAENIIVKLSGGEAFVVADGTDTISISSISGNSSASVSKSFKCLNSAQSGVYPITASISYEYIEAGAKQQGSDELTMSIPVVQPDKVMFQDIELADKTVTLGEETDCAFKIVNTGKTVLNNGTVKLLDENKNEINSAYIGNIEAGAQYSSNYNLPFTLDEEGNKKLFLVYEYENQNAEKKSITQEFRVTVEEYMDPYPVTPDEEEIPQETGMSTKTKVIIGVCSGIALILLITVLIIVLKKKKHKKGKVDFNEEI